MECPDRDLGQLLRGAVTLALAAYSLIETGVSATYGALNMSGTFEDGGIDVSEPSVTIPGYGASIDRTVRFGQHAGPTTGSIWMGIGPNLGVTATYSRGPDGQDVLSSVTLSIGPSFGAPAGVTVPFSKLFRRER